MASEKGADRGPRADEARHVALASAWPRALIEAGLAEEITEDWLVRVDQAVEAGYPNWPRFALDPSLADGLFEVRRARRVVRGLDAVAEALDREKAGLQRAAATRPKGRRISRLLLLGADGSARFYRQAERVQQEHLDRLAVAVIEADELGLGAALFGPGKRARAVMVDHKDAVIAILDRLRGQAPWNA
ncbi:MAG: hypothetical protein ACPGVZ_10235 [Myxococcota bacterium]